MRRIAVVGMIILGLVALPLIAGAVPDGKAKELVCHMPDAGGGAPHTIEISQKALQKHLDHGDLPGTCEGLIVDSEAPNNAPTASFVVAEQSCDGFFIIVCSVTLDGSGSHDPDNDALTYSWFFSSGQPFESTTSQTLTVFSLEPGDYSFSLTVDDGSLSDTVTKMISVTP